MEESWRVHPGPVLGSARAEPERGGWNRARGHLPEGDAVLIGNWPVQFLPAETPLLREAVEQAQAYDYDGVPTRVMSAEHLMAIALQTRRAKDYARLVTFVEAGVADPARWEEIIERHGLREAWRRFETRYLDGP